MNKKPFHLYIMFASERGRNNPIIQEWLTGATASYWSGGLLQKIVYPDMSLIFCSPDTRYIQGYSGPSSIKISDLVMRELHKEHLDKLILECRARLMVTMGRLMPLDEE